MARSIHQPSPLPRVRRRRSASSETVGLRLHEMLLNTSHRDKQRLLHEMEAGRDAIALRRGADSVDQVDEAEEDDERGSDVDESQLAKPVAGLALESTLLDTAYNTELTLLDRQAKNLKEITIAFAAASISLENSSELKAGLKEKAAAVKGLKEDLAEEVQNLKASMEIYPTTSQELWFNIQETNKLQTREISNVKIAFAALLKKQEEELQTYHDHLKQIKLTARDEVRKSSDPKTIQREASRAVKAALEAAF